MASNSVKLSSGAMMPLMGLGTWQAKDGKALQEVVLEAIKTGYRHIDTAFLYGNEEAIGDALQKAFKSGIVKREDMFIVTKLPGFGHNPEKTKSILEISLKKLQLPFVDLYLIHFPIATKGDEKSPFGNDESGKSQTEEVDPMATWKEMEKLVDEGLTKAIGLSNYNSEQIKEIYDAARIKPVNLQVECNAYFQQEKLFKFCKDLGISFTAYAPIGSPGFKTFVKETYQYDVPDIPSVMENPVIVGLSKKYNKTPAQICLRWLIQRGIIVIPKSTSIQRVKENFQVFDFQLSEEDMAGIKQVDKNMRVFSMDFGGMKEHPRYPFKIPF